MLKIILIIIGGYMLLSIVAAIINAYGEIIIMLLIAAAVFYIWRKNEQKKNQALHVEDLVKRAKQGDPEAQYQLAQIYLKEDKAAEAVNLLARSAKQGNIGALYLLGMCFKQGNGIEADPLRAARFFRTAADQNNVDAQYELALCYKEGHGFNRDLQLAVKYFSDAVRHNHSDAKYELGCCYMRGLGVGENDKEAIRLLTEANNQKSRQIIGISTIEYDSKELKDSYVYKIIKEIQYVLYKEHFILSDIKGSDSWLHPNKYGDTFGIKVYTASDTNGRYSKTNAYLGEIIFSRSPHADGMWAQTNDILFHPNGRKYISVNGEGVSILITYPGETDLWLVICVGILNNHGLIKQHA